jgi:hypothetical protein
MDKMSQSLLRFFLFHQKIKDNFLLVNNCLSLKPVIHQANLFARTEKKATDMIGWRQTLTTTSPANHIQPLLVRAKNRLIQPFCHPKMADSRPGCIP